MILSYFLKSWNFESKFVLSCDFYMNVNSALSTYKVISTWMVTQSENTHINFATFYNLIFTSDAKIGASTFSWECVLNKKGKKGVIRPITFHFLETIFCVFFPRLLKYCHSFHFKFFCHTLCQGFVNKIYFSMQIKTLSCNDYFS